MNLKTHRIKIKKGKVSVYKRLNNPNEIFGLGLDFFRLFAVLIFAVLGIGVMNKSIGLIGPIGILIIGLILFSGWLGYSMIENILITWKRIMMPILIIDGSRIKLQDEQGQLIGAKSKDVKAIQGRMYREIRTLDLEDAVPKMVYYSKISLSLNSGKDLLIDIINSSKLYDPNQREAKSELKAKTKAIGTCLAEQLKVQFYWENKMSIVE